MSQSTTTVPSTLRGPAPAPLRDRRFVRWLGAGAVGIAAGGIALALGTAELRWTAFGLIAVIAALIVYLAPDRTSLLTVLFILGMQADVYIRPFYGRAGTAGLEIPLCVLIGGALYLQLRLTSDRSVIRFGELKRPILAILATTAIATVFNEERFAGVGRFLFEVELVFVYMLGFDLVLREDGLRRAIRLLAITLAVQTIVSFIQSWTGMNFSLIGETSELGSIPRPGGTVSANPAGFASYIMPIILILAARYVAARQDHRRSAFETIPIILGIVAIIMTYTRAAWGGLVLGLATITVIGIRRRYITLRQVGILAAVMIIGVIAAMPMINARLTEAPLGESYDERAALNRMALLVIGAHPVFGIGPGAYGFAYKNYLTRDLADAWMYTVHNEYLLRAAETGIVGGLVFIALLLRALSQARRLSNSSDWEFRTFGLGWTAALIALSWQMYWVPWRGFTYNSMLWLLLGMTEGALLISKRREAAKSVEGDGS